MPIINTVISGGSSPTPSGKYQLLQRVTDDSNNEIGTVCGFHTDANDVEYAVVCLDAQYRLASGQYLSVQALVTGLQQFGTQVVWGYLDTATSNCDKILAFIDGTAYTSSAVSHCRSKSFVVDGTTYYGQLPTIVELTDVFRNRIAINTKDTSAGQYSSLVVPYAIATWSSTQANDAKGWQIKYDGTIGLINKNSDAFVIPILELPNA